MYKVEILPEAIEDILQIVNYIGEDNVYYANKVKSHIKKTILLLSSFPYLWIEIDNIHRKIIESKYRYKIVYRIENNYVYIVSVFREQNKWNN